MPGIDTDLLQTVIKVSYLYGKGPSKEYNLNMNSKLKSSLSIMLQEAAENTYLSPF